MGIIATQTQHMLDVVTRVFKEQAHVLVTHGLVGRDDRDVLVGVTRHRQRLQGGNHCIGPGGQAGLLTHRFMDAINKTVVALNTTPEGFC